MKFSKGTSENLSPSPCFDHECWVWGLMSYPQLWLCPPLQLCWRMSLLPLENACQSLLQPSPIFPTTYNVSCMLMTSLCVRTVTGHQTLFMKCTGMRPAHSNRLTLLQKQKVAAVAFPGPARSTQALSFMFPFCISPKRDICNIWSCCYSVYNLDVFVKKKKKKEIN